MSRWTVLLDTESFRTLTFEADDLMVDNTDGTVSYALMQHFQVDGQKELGERVVFASTATSVAAVWEEHLAVPERPLTPVVTHA